MITVKELKNLGKFIDAGSYADVCEIRGCMEWATHYVKIRRGPRVIETYKLCKPHHSEYLKVDPQEDAATAAA